MNTFDMSDIFNSFSPLILTEAISTIKTDEPLILTSRPGKNKYNMHDEVTSLKLKKVATSLLLSASLMTRSVSSIFQESVNVIRSFLRRFSCAIESVPPN